MKVQEFKSKKLKGSVTAFLSLVMILIVVFIVECMDAASIQNKTYFGLLAQNNDDKAATTRQMDFINRMSATYGMDKAKMSTT